jgi:drug/metabolite transporter (DMT)-like permease
MLGIVLALGASACWGSGDFLGGLTTRRASLWAVIIGSQAVGLVGAALVTVLTGHAWPGLAAVWPVLLGGVASVIAISCFYKALAIGSMSIVAPISATSAMIPFLVGLALGERPGVAQLVGVALAAVGVVLVASERARAGDTIGAAALPNEPAIQPAALDARPERRNQRRAIALSLLAAVCMGLVLIGYDATARHDALWAMLGGRMSSAVLFVLVFLAIRPRVEMRRSAVPFIVAVGLLDTGANGLFALATTHGYLSIVAVIGSVYPVVTVVLAYVVLRERLARYQLAGALSTLAGIALIAAG